MSIRNDHEFPQLANGVHKMQLMTLKDVAISAQVSESTVRRWVQSQELPAYRLGRQLRFRQEEFESFLDKRRLANEADPKETDRRSNEPEEGR